MPQAAGVLGSGTAADLGCGLGSGDAGLQSTAGAMLDPAAVDVCVHAPGLQPRADAALPAATDACARALSLQTAADAMLEAAIDACVAAPSLQSGASYEPSAASAPAGASSAAAAVCPADAAIVTVGVSGSLPTGATTHGDSVAEIQDAQRQQVEDAAQRQTGRVDPSGGSGRSDVVSDESELACPGGRVGGSGTCDGLSVVAVTALGGVDVSAGDGGGYARPLLCNRAVASRAGEAGRRVLEDLEELRRFWVPEYSSSCSVSVAGSVVGNASMHGGEASGNGGRCPVHGHTGSADAPGVSAVEGRAASACEDDGSVKEAGSSLVRHAVAGATAERGEQHAGALDEGSSVAREVSADASMALEVTAQVGDAGREVAERVARDGAQGKSDGVRFAAGQPRGGTGNVGGGWSGREATVEGDAGVVEGSESMWSSARLSGRIEQSCSLFGDPCMSEWSLGSGGALAGSSRLTGVDLLPWIVRRCC